VAAYHDYGDLIAAKVLHPDPKCLEPRALGMVGPERLWLVDSRNEASAILSFHERRRERGVQRLTLLEKTVDGVRRGIVADVLYASLRGRYGSGSDARD
jgi:hypothetical protein